MPARVQNTAKQIIHYLEMHVSMITNPDDPSFTGKEKEYREYTYGYMSAMLDSIKNSDLSLWEDE